MSSQRSTPDLNNRFGKLMHRAADASGNGEKAKTKSAAPLVPAGTAQDLDSSDESEMSRHKAEAARIWELIRRVGAVMPKRPATSTKSSTLPGQRGFTHAATAEDCISCNVAESHEAGYKSKVRKFEMNFASGKIRALDRDKVALVMGKILNKSKIVLGNKLDKKGLKEKKTWDRKKILIRKNHLSTKKGLTRKVFKGNKILDLEKLDGVADLRKRR